MAFEELFNFMKFLQGHYFNQFQEDFNDVNGAVSLVISCCRQCPYVDDNEILPILYWRLANVVINGKIIIFFIIYKEWKNAIFSSKSVMVS